MSSDEEESFDEEVSKRSRQFGKAKVRQFVDFQSLFSPKLIFERYKRNSKAEKSVFVIVFFALLLAFGMSVAGLMDVTRSLPPTLVIVEYLKQLTTIQFVNIACFNSLQQNALGFHSFFNQTSSEIFTLTCPQKMADLRFELKLVRSTDRFQNRLFGQCFLCRSQQRFVLQSVPRVLQQHLHNVLCEG